MDVGGIEVPDAGGVFFAALTVHVVAGASRVDSRCRVGRLPAVALPLTVVALIRNGAGLTPPAARWRTRRGPRSRPGAARWR
jgi:hypothetical protein